MSKLATIVLAGLITASPAVSQTAVPDLRGTWKGESETIILGTGNAHHGSPSSPAPRLSSVPFTLTIDNQEGRRFLGEADCAVERIEEARYPSSDGNRFSTCTVPTTLESSPAGDDELDEVMVW
jgi:hypothetical protein